MVRFASPLLLDAVADDGLILERQLSRMRCGLPGIWPGSRWIDERWETHRLRQVLTPKMGDISEDESFERVFHHAGVVVRLPSDPAGAFGLKVIDDQLEVVLGLGPHLLLTFGPTAELRLDGALPETVATAIGGRQLDEVVSHPLFIGRRYPITEALQPPQVRHGGTTIRFRTGRTGFAMPWDNVFKAILARGRARPSRSGSSAVRR